MAALRQGKNRRVQVPVVAVVALKFQVEIPVLGWITKHQCGINELEIWWRFTLCTSHRYRLPGNACPSIFNDARLCILLTFFAHKIRWWNLRLSGLIPLQEGSSSCESWRGYFFFWEMVHLWFLWPAVLMLPDLLSPCWDYVRKAQFMLPWKQDIIGTGCVMLRHAVRWYEIGFPDGGHFFICGLLYFVG